MNVSVDEMNRIEKGGKVLRENPIFEDIELVDLTEDAKKANPYRLLIIKGVASRGGVVNRNNRIYPTSVLNKTAEKAQSMIRNGKLLGGLDHPEVGVSQLRDAAIKFTSMWMEGDYLKFEADVMPTQQGQQLEVLLRSGVGVGMSTRGYGSTKEVEIDGRIVYEVQPDYELKAVDAVLNESNEWSKIANFESEQVKGGEKMEITLEKLKTEHSGIVKQLEDEIKEALTASLQEQIKKDLEREFEQKVSAAIEEKMKEAKKDTDEAKELKLEVKKLKSVISAIVKALKPVLPEDAETGSDGSDETSAELEKARAESAAKDEKIQTLESEKAEAERKLKERETRDKISALIEEKVKGHRFEAQLRTRLSDCRTEEEVGQKFEKEVQFIESLISGSTQVPKGSAETGEEKKGEQDLSETKQRHRLLAGIQEGGK